MTEEFKIPSKVSTNDLQKLLGTFNEEKQKRIDEILTRLHKQATDKNIEKVEKLLDRRIQTGELNPDYTLANNSNNSVRSNLRNTLGNMLHKVLGRDRQAENTIEEAIDSIMNAEDDSGFAVVDAKNKRVIHIPTNFVIDCLQKYKDKGNNLPYDVELLIGKNENDLSSNEEMILADYFGNNDEFSIFVIKEKMRGE